MAQESINPITVLKDTWPVFRENLVLALGVPAILSWVPFIVVGIPACVISFVIALVTGLANRDAVGPVLIPVGLISGLIFAVAYNAVRVNWIRISLALVRNQGASFHDLMEISPWLVNFVIVNLIIGVATAIGAFFLVVPGVFIAVRTSLAPYLVVEENLGPVEALLKSNELVTGYSWQMLAIYVAYLAAGFTIGAIPVVGAVAVMGYMDLALTQIYLQRNGESLESSEVDENEDSTTPAR